MIVVVFITRIDSYLQEGGIYGKKIIDKHYKEYVEIKGKVCEIPSNGKHILICDVNDSFGYDFIYCGIETTELKDQVYNLSIGDTIIVKGKISGVNVIYDYQMDVYSIK